MARRRVKRRTHAGAERPKNAKSEGHGSGRDPKSMVIRIGAGEVGSSVSQLVTDVRRVMEPGTAIRLKERKANRLRDYITMTGPLGVTHLLLFSRSETGNTNLRMALAPRGPTLHFKVEKYSLCKDIQKAQRHPRGGGKEFLNPPLLVMNNFSSPTANPSSTVPKHLETLATTVFQSLFPPINPQTTPLKSMQRVLLLNREPSTDKEDGSFVLNFRHYAITTKSTGLSRPLKRLNAAEKLLSSKLGKKGSVPNLGKLNDIADFMIGGEAGEGYMTDATSGSEVDTDAEVEVLDESARKTHRPRKADEEAEEEEKVEKRAVKLVELGPRMRLRLAKVEEGMCSGKILWHEYIHKSKEEVQELEKRWEKRRQEKERRKKEQKENLAKKRAAKAKSGKKGEDDDGDEELDYYSGSDMDIDDYDSDASRDAHEQAGEAMDEDGGSGHE